ncbi:hypothetical protein TrST_g1065 [Triparma strigata]|uniref:RING-type domain-containing protein n=1 Tax=Triparma strigata TaxID=1606541 RepID=A0A9W7A2W9_9STRA|nr:hypothetical protein TrST_g1065 [Triparma strigata]
MGNTCLTLAAKLIPISNPNGMGDSSQRHHRGRSSSRNSGFPVFRSRAVSGYRGNRIAETPHYTFGDSNERIFQRQMQQAIAQSILDQSTRPPDDPAPIPTKLSSDELKKLTVTKYNGYTPPPLDDDLMVAVPPTPSHKMLMLDAGPVEPTWKKSRSNSGDTDLLSTNSDDFDGLELECSICWAEFQRGDAIIALPCNSEHKFHEKCIGEWLVEKSSLCPICRGDVGDFIRKPPPTPPPLAFSTPTTPASTMNEAERRRVGEMSAAVVSSALILAQGKIMLSSVLGGTARIAPMEAPTSISTNE